MRIEGPDGEILPRDGESIGELVVRGPWVISNYFKMEGAGKSFTEDGWFRTGDVAALDADGYMRIADRVKDLIKSGGEWISSVDMENALMAHPAVAEAAVVARPDPKWDERPVAFLVPRPGREAELTPGRGAGIPGRQRRLRQVAGAVRRGHPPDRRHPAHLGRQVRQEGAAAPVRSGLTANGGNWRLPAVAACRADARPRTSQFRCGRPALGPNA